MEKSKQTYFTKLNIISVSWKAGFRFRTVFCTTASNIQVLVQETPPPDWSMFLFQFPARGFSVFTLCVGHNSVKPLVSSFWFTQAQPYPTLLCSALSGLRSVVPGHWRCSSTGSRSHTYSSGVHNKYTSSHLPRCLMCQIMQLHIETKVLEEANQKNWYGFDLTVHIPG